MKKMLFILNPYAGQRKGNKYLAEILAIFNRADYDVSVYVTGGSGEAKEVAKQLCKEDNLEIVSMLAKEGYFTEELLSEFQTRASASGRAEMASYLLNYRMEHFKPKKKTFDFDEF